MAVMVLGCVDEGIEGQYGKGDDDDNTETCGDCKGGGGGRQKEEERERGYRGQYKLTYSSTWQDKGSVAQ
ncbi:hypothetical protein PAMP_014269 [Pampus punctatissimus]